MAFIEMDFLSGSKAEYQTYHSKTSRISGIVHTIEVEGEPVFVYTSLPARTNVCYSGTSLWTKDLGFTLLSKSGGVEGSITAEGNVVKILFSGSVGQTSTPVENTDIYIGYLK